MRWRVSRKHWKCTACIMSKWAMVILSSFESVVSKLEKRSKNRASKKFVFDTRATAKERITRISSNNYNFLIFLSFAFGKDEVGSSNLPSSSTGTPLSQDSGVFVMIFCDRILTFRQFCICFVITSKSADGKRMRSFCLFFTPVFSQILLPICHQWSTGNFCSLSMVALAKSEIGP